VLLEGVLRNTCHPWQPRKVEPSMESETLEKRFLETVSVDFFLPAGNVVKLHD
jgi:hypothetical protein